MKTKTTYGELTKGLVGAFIALITMFAFVGYSVGSTLGSSTVTIASTTERITINTSEVSTVTETLTESSLTVQTTTEYLTVTFLGPPAVEISGTAVTRTPGTTPESVIFVSASNNSTFLAKVSSGRYSVSIPNHDSYNAQIEFTNPLSVGGGRCSVGGLVLHSPQNMTTFNVSC